MTTVIVGTRGTSGHQFAGSMWVRLQYMLGLRALGIDAYWVDRLPAEEEANEYFGLEYKMWRFRRTLEDFGLDERYCVIVESSGQYVGMSEAMVADLVKRADLLLNISGYLPPACPLAGVQRKAFIDVDPGFTQIWAHQSDIRTDGHDLFFTVGQNVGSPGFRIPQGHVQWIPIVPPVYLPEWPLQPPPSGDSRFSTVADWRASQDAMFEGEYYGGKRKEFIRFLRLPRDSGQRFVIALCISFDESEDIDLLAGNRWQLVSPGDVAGDPRAYREFVQRSSAEFSVAKSGYVKSRCGWISDRTGCYLASGRPAVVQSTGFEPYIPTGEGLLTFTTLDEAMAAVADVNARYEQHYRAARRLAETHFSTSVVLPRILEHAGVPFDEGAVHTRI